METELLTFHFIDVAKLNRTKDIEKFNPVRICVLKKIKKVPYSVSSGVISV